MHTYSPMLVTPLILLVIALIWWSNKHSARSILSRQFKATFDPGGPYTECQIRFNYDDMPAPCVVRTTAQGWYMLTPEAMRRRINWSNNVAFLREPVFIPWESLDYYTAKFPMASWVRFDVKGTKALFFVKRDVTLPLLQAGGMPPPV
jgi:hypothetical protein